MEDREIIDLYWKRSENAIAETAAKYGRYCYRIAYQILNSGPDAEECVNDTYLGAWNAIPPQRPERFSAFLGKIARHAALGRHDYYSAQKRNKNLDVLLSELEGCLPAGDRVEREYEAAETARLISAFLREQDEEPRNVFLRRYWYADSIRDVADRFGMSESKVKSMLFRTRNKLQKYLEKEGVSL